MKWYKGNIVQIDPDHDPDFGGCFMIVTEEKDWGAQGYIEVPGKGPAYYRLRYDKGKWVGLAIWEREREDDED